MLETTDRSNWWLSWTVAIMQTTRQSWWWISTSDLYLNHCHLFTFMKPLSATSSLRLCCHMATELQCIKYSGIANSEFSNFFKMCEYQSSQYVLCIGAWWATVGTYTSMWASILCIHTVLSLVEVKVFRRKNLHMDVTEDWAQNPYCRSPVCEIWNYNSFVAEDRGLFRFYAMLTGCCCLKELLCM